MITDINASTGIFSVIGYPIGHSLSPEMHNTAITKMHINYAYVPFEVHPDRLKDAVTAIYALNIRGVNVTIPHKVKVMSHLDQLSDEARLSGAVNTIYNENGKLYGHNTDGMGFIMSLKLDGNIVPENKKVVILGSGGAARGIAVALAKSGVKEIIIASRNEETGKDIFLILERAKNGIKAKWVKITDKCLKGEIINANILINATPVGMYPNDDVSPVNDFSIFHKELTVCDLVYNPIKTKFLRDAARAGCNIVDGTGMLAYQGGLSLKIWTGMTPPFKLMKDVLIGKLQKRED